MSNFYVYLRNPNSGEVHRVVEDGKSRFVDERCNLDDAQMDGFERLEDEDAALIRVKAGGDLITTWCGHCCAGLIAAAHVTDSITDPGDAAESASN